VLVRRPPFPALSPAKPSLVQGRVPVLESLLDYVVVLVGQLLATVQDPVSQLQNYQGGPPGQCVGAEMRRSAAERILAEVPAMLVTLEYVPVAATVAWWVYMIMCLYWAQPFW
jgi:hypothetical protein